MEAPLMRYSLVETSLDDVLSDALREEAGTESDLRDWYPITTKLKVGKVTGRQLRAFWEREAEHVFSPDPEKLFGGWLPRPSGIDPAVGRPRPGRPPGP
jgi:hypothetical protein